MHHMVNLHTISIHKIRTILYNRGYFCKLKDNRSKMVISKVVRLEFGGILELDSHMETSLQLDPGCLGHS